MGSFMFRSGKSYHLPNSSVYRTVRTIVAYTGVGSPHSPILCPGGDSSFRWCRRIANTQKHNARWHVPSRPRVPNQSTGWKHLLPLMARHLVRLPAYQLTGCTGRGILITDCWDQPAGMVPHKYGGSRGRGRGSAGGTGCASPALSPPATQRMGPPAVL